MDIELRPVVAGDGHVAHLRLHHAGPGAPGLLWMPALGVPAEKYDAFGRALAGLGITCAVHEWRGNASSSLRARRGSDWGYRELLQQDLPASIAALAPGAWYFGGHSLGGQFAAMAAARQPAACRGLVLAATGVPDARTFRGRQRLGIGLFARSIPLVTALAGYYPGHRLKFAGREAARLMRDWAATVHGGRYRDYGDGEAMDQRLARLSLPTLGLRFSGDWLVPEASLQALVDKLGGGEHRDEFFDESRLGTTPDHFRWLRRPEAPAAAIARWIGLSP
ncbi:MAG TPA: alpha/beta fold hydrolase [Arenimonas sp.]|uniref:alpha/beta hydrolase family protein n=1 Tax=Arenimonas sp. TaxID=1872635 RepID=UPI002D80B804|nr:alpha/beta fold hydrolase [Arenimonas sp.]HEU0153778.1 alpha/beta fold hydrolase [Arenimonas sp.]